MERSVIVADAGRPNLERALPTLQISTPSLLAPEKVLTVNELQELEKKNLLAALQACNWKIAGDNGAARLLGMKPSTLNSRISTLNLKKPQ